MTETLLVEGGRHSWLYEFPAYRAAIARFLTESLGGPFTPDEAAAVAAAVPAVRLPDPERLTTLDEEPGGFRSLTRVLRRRESAPRDGHEQAAGDAGEAPPHSGGSPSSSMIATAAVSSSMSSPSSAASAESEGAAVGPLRRGGALGQVGLDRRLEADVAVRLLREQPLVLEHVAVGLHEVAVGADELADPRQGRPVDLAQPALGGLVGPDRRAARRTRATPATRRGRGAGSAPAPRACAAASGARARWRGSGAW